MKVHYNFPLNLLLLVRRKDLFRAQVLVNILERARRLHFQQCFLVPNLFRQVSIELLARRCGTQPNSSQGKHDTHLAELFDARGLHSLVMRRPKHFVSTKPDYNADLHANCNRWEKSMSDLDGHGGEYAEEMVKQEGDRG
jgi:hypothetical protein